MDFSALETALFLFKITEDGMYKDAIRVLTSPRSPQMEQNALAYIETGWRDYLTLFANSDKHRVYEPRFPYTGPGRHG